MLCLVRIGTWNIAGRWSEHHQALLVEADCDVWLLTEVNERTVLPKYSVQLSQERMAPRRRWAGIASRLPMASSPDPHPASAQAQIGATTYVSSILPWRSCGANKPWVGDRHVDKTENAIDDLLLHLRVADSLVWGGDWNHALTGKEYAGSIGGRQAVLAALESVSLDATTAGLPHRIDGLFTIDHLAVPAGLSSRAWRIDATHECKRLSDHDAYVVEVDL